MNLPADLWIRHVLAQQSKAFFGHGPKGRAAAYVQGRIAAFTSEMAGPGMVEALRAEAFGRLCMRYINHRYVECARPELRRLAAGAGVALGTVGSDLDFETGVSVGIAVADQPLPGAPPDGPDARLAARLGAVEARVGPVLAVAWLRGPVPPPDAAGEWLRHWADRSAAAATALRQALGQTGQAAFLIPDGDRWLAGMILRG